MATIGYTTTPSFGNWARGFNTDNQVALQVTMPSTGGQITTLHAYAATFLGTATMVLAVWDNSGNVLASISASSASGTSPGWVSGTLGTPLTVAGGAVIYLGWTNTNNTSSQCGFLATYDQAGGTCKDDFQATVPGNLLGGSSPESWSNRNIGAYADYSASQVYVRRSGAWVTVSPVYVRRSGAWVQAPVYVRRSGAWVQIA